MKGLLLVSLTDLMVDLFVMNRPAEWSQKYEVAYFFVGILLNTQHSEAENHTWLSQDAQSIVKTSKWNITW